MRTAQRTAQQTGNLKHLHDAIAKMPYAREFCTRSPHLEGEEVFVSLKREADLAPGSEFDSHRPGKISVSRPSRRARRSDLPVVDLTSKDATDNATAETTAPVDLVSDSHDDAPAQNFESGGLDHDSNDNNGATIVRNEKSLPFAADGRPQIHVEETACNDRDWHISRLPKESKKACFALQANTRKKCTSLIIKHNKSTAAPTYVGMMENYKKSRLERHQFYFCNDDLQRCVKGTRRKWVVSVPPIPDVWPVKIGTRLSKTEIIALEDAGFKLPKRVQLSLNKLFGEKTSLDVRAYPEPLNPSTHATMRSGKRIRRNPNAPTEKHYNNCASALSVQGKILRLLLVPPTALGCIVSLESKGAREVKTYMLTVGAFPSCSCPDFKKMLGMSLGKRGAWLNCKHLYYIFNIVCELDPDEDIFIHAPSFSWNEVKRVVQVLLVKHFGS